MSHYIKNAGVWKKANPWVKVAGVWKFPDYVYHKVAGRWYTSFVKGGLVDRSWDDRDQTGFMGTGANTSITAIALQTDGKIIAVGYFTTWDGTTVNKIVRLNADGTRDTAFTTALGTGPAGNITSMTIQTDGKILVGGSFTTWNGTSTGCLVRLNSTGTLDTAFAANAGAGASQFVRAIVVQTDGKIIIGGDFTSWNGVTVNRIARLDSTGVRDTAFTTANGTGAGNAVHAIALQTDGKILVGGFLTSWNAVTVGRIVRLDSTGARDTAFTTANGTGASGFVYAIAVQSDGKILVGGSFTSWNAVTVNRIVRLDSTGARETAFTTNTGTGANSTVYSFSLYADGRILVGGIFSTFNSITVNRIVRLSSNGTRDTAFTTAIGGGPNSTIVATLLQADGKIFIAGDFTFFDALPANYIIRLNSDGTQESLTKFANSSVYAIAVQSDGKILVGGFFTKWNDVAVGSIVRLNADGTRDTTFATNIGTGGNSNVNAIAIQTDGKILVGGAFTLWNGVTVNRIVRLNTDGTRDTAFTTNIGTGPVNTVNAIAVQTNGGILVSGSFLTWNGATVNYIVRLGSTGVRDTAFTTNTGTSANSTVLTIALQADGKILVGGQFTLWNAVTVGRIVRLNADGTRDTAFTTANGTGANALVSTVAVQADGKILVGGQFTLWNAVTVGNIVRLDSTGARETAFTTANGTASSSNINAIALQADGKILVGGGFLDWNGAFINRIVRLDSTGARETAFNINTGRGANNPVQCITVQTDKKVLIGGGFGTFGNIGYRRCFVRIGGEDAA